MLPTSLTRQRGPTAPWITTAGWASGAKTELGDAWIVSMAGVVTPERALDLLSETGTTSPHRRSRARRRVPEPVVTAAKDVRRLREARRLRHAVLVPGPWTSTDVAFVWQRHDLFHTAGFDLARRLDRPVVVAVHGGVVRESEGWGVHRPGWGKLVERFGEFRHWRRADLLTCVSDEVVAIAEEAGVDRDRILVTPNGVDLSLFQESDGPSPIRERFGLVDQFVVGWSGSFRRFHGLEDAIRAIVTLQKDIPNIALLLVGDGLDRPRIEDAARTMGVRRLVITGTVPYRHVPDYLAAMDVAVVLTGHEQAFHYSPVKLREYMACGLPVVAPRIGELPRMIEDGVNGRLVEPRNTQELASAILQLARNGPLRARVGRQARLDIERTGSWEAQVRAVLKRLEDF